MQSIHDSTDEHIATVKYTPNLLAFLEDSCFCLSDYSLQYERNLTAQSFCLHFLFITSLDL